MIRLCWADDPCERPTFNEIVKMIDEILIDSSIYDRVGKNYSSLSLRHTHKLMTLCIIKDVNSGGNTSMARLKSPGIPL